MRGENRYALLSDRESLATCTNLRKMSRITLDLLRKRSEHNEGEISTLEEIALHQENISKIELIGETCRHLKILLLQHNLISKIENLNKLKRLEYLNLALNNIEVIENLEGLESLKKLDLTVNFVGDLAGVRKLRCNEQLEQLFLMGNPCADYEGYREYVIVTLPLLKELDGTEILRSERIKALQAYPAIEGEILRSCARQKKVREAQLLDSRQPTKSSTNRQIANGHPRKEEGKEEASENEEEVEDDDDDDDEAFWNRSSRHTPEERVAIAERFLRKQERRNRERERENETRIRPRLKLFSPEGKPYNVNQPKVSFKLDEESDSDRIVLEVALYKHLDTGYVDVDVQPEYVRVTIKGKVLQLTLPCEVSVDASTAQRNTVNGKLLITMPRLSPLPTLLRNDKKVPRKTEMVERRSMTSVRQYLEIGPDSESDLDFSKIAERATLASAEQKQKQKQEQEQKMYSDENCEVPPLE